MKKSIRVLAGVMACVLLAACSIINPGLRYPKATENIEISFSWWGTAARTQSLRNVVEAYTRRHPNIKIRVLYGALDGWEQKLRGRLASGAEADIVMVSYAWAHSFGRGKNVFYDLNQLKSFVDLSNWDDYMLDALTVNGQLAAVPFGLAARLPIYNVEFFERYGIEFPKTYDELIEAGGIVGKNNQPYGGDNRYVMTDIGKASVDYFIAQILFDTTGKTMQQNGVVNYTAQEVAQALEIYASFEKANALPTFAEEDAIQNEYNPVWTQGRTGSFLEWFSSSSAYLQTYGGGTQQNGFRLGRTITMDAEKELQIYTRPTVCFAVSKNTPYPALAADFINFLFTDEEAVDALADSFGVSVNKETRSQQNARGLVGGVLLEGAELLANSPTIMVDPYFEERNVRGARYKAIEAFRSGAMSAAEAAQEYIDLQNAALRMYYR